LAGPGDEEVTELTRMDTMLPQQPSMRMECR
jgi:hypothetical protein